MRPHSYSAEGIILGRRNFGEADRILSVYSKTLGKITLIAKGIRRPKSRKRGHLEIFSLINFQANSGQGVDLMTEVDITKDFKDIRKSLPKISLAYYFTEVVGKITHEGEPNMELFDLLQDFLTNLNLTNSLKKLRMDFILKLLTLMGYWPENKEMTDPDLALAEVIERQLTSARVGKRMLS